MAAPVVAGLAIGTVRTLGLKLAKLAIRLKNADSKAEKAQIKKAIKITKKAKEQSEKVKAKAKNVTRKKAEKKQRRGDNKNPGRKEARENRAKQSLRGRGTGLEIYRSPNPSFPRKY